MFLTSNLENKQLTSPFSQFLTHSLKVSPQTAVGIIDYNGRRQSGRRSEEREAGGPASDDGTQQLYTAGSTFPADGEEFSAERIAD